VVRVSSEPTKETITEKIEIDANTYANVSTTSTEYTLASGKKVTETISKSKLTYYDYEVEQNEAKRKIKLLKSEYVSQNGLMNELERVLNQ